MAVDGALRQCVRLIRVRLVWILTNVTRGEVGEAQEAPTSGRHARGPHIAQRKAAKARSRKVLSYTGDKELHPF